MSDLPSPRFEDENSCGYVRNKPMWVFDLTDNQKREYALRFPESIAFRYCQIWNSDESCESFSGKLYTLLDYSQSRYRLNLASSEDERKAIQIDWIAKFCVSLEMRC